MTDSTFTPLHRSLTYRLHYLHKVSDMATQRMYEQQVGLSLSEGRCLATIGTFAPVSINDLAHAANLNKAQASRAAQQLVSKQLVLKAEDPNDKRGVQLRLSSTGKKYWLQTMQLIQERNQVIFSSLNPEEEQIFSDLLDKLIADLPEP